MHQFIQLEKRENEKKDEEIKGNKANLEFYKLKLEEGEKVCEENAKVIRFLNQKLNESYQPFKNILKNLEIFINSVFAR